MSVKYNFTAVFFALRGREAAKNRGKSVKIKTAAVNKLLRLRFNVVSDAVRQNRYKVFVG